jgi:hypothetical protein
MSFTNGFHSVIPQLTLQVFTTSELSLLLSGSHLIDVQDWRAHTEYRGGYTPTDPIIQWFWHVLEGFSQD